MVHYLTIIYVYIYVYIYKYLYIYIYICIYIYIYIYIYSYLCLYLYLYLYLSIHLSIYLSIYLSFYLYRYILYYIILCYVTLITLRNTTVVLNQGVIDKLQKKLIIAKKISVTKDCKIKYCCHCSENIPTGIERCKYVYACFCNLINHLFQPCKASS